MHTFLKAPRLWEAMLDEIDVLVGVIDRQGHVQLINRAAEQTTGYDRDEVAGRSAIDTFIPEEERAEVGAALDQLLAAPTALSIQSHLVAKDGRQRFIHWSGVSGPGEDEEHGAGYAVVIGVDRTRERELEHELARADEALRQRLGAELHDMLASHLAGTAMLGAAFTRQIEKGVANATEALQTLTEMIREAADQARALSHSFAAPELEEGGLGRAIEQLSTRAESVSGVACSCTVEDQARAVAPAGEVATHLYRIAQEALHNAIVHAAPSEIAVRMEVQAQSETAEAPSETRTLLVLVIRDDGVGIPEEVEEGVGLRSMRRRAHLVGASLRVERREAGGTRVQCALPLSERASGE